LDGNRQNFAMLVVMGDHHIGGTWKKKIKWLMRIHSVRYKVNILDSRISYRALFLRKMIGANEFLVLLHWTSAWSYCCSYSKIWRWMFFLLPAPTLIASHP
jgi:hypothetical protein